MTDTTPTRQTFRYWIDTGRTNGQFTLHRDLVVSPEMEARREHFGIRRYTYIRNLGRVYAEACARADKFIAEMHTDGYSFDYIKEYDASDDWGDRRNAGRYDDDEFWFGKYEGKSLDWVHENRPNYLFYIRDYFITTDPRTKCLIEKIEAMDLGKSPAQVEKEKREAREQEVEENLTPIPAELAEGRHTFTGEILAEYSRDYGYGPTTKLIIVDDRGFKINGTCPSGFFWYDDPEFPGQGIQCCRKTLRGCRVEFDATLTISDNDECFGFFKRPTKAEVTKEAS